MTPLPVITDELRLVVPRPQPPAPVRQAICVRPGCTRTARHHHHIVNRTITNGPVNWVEIHASDTRRFLVCNVADLCPYCHDSLESQIGGTKARLRFLDGNGWGWYRISDETDKGVARIWWFDKKNKSAWVFVGFLDGDKWVR